MNTIVERIADFKEYSPFDHLTFQELSEIALYSCSKFAEKKTLFQYNDVLHDGLRRGFWSNSLSL
jgi:CBS domain-containing protein